MEVQVPAMSHKALRLAKRRKLAELDPLSLPSTTSETPSTTTSSAQISTSTPVAIGQTPTKSAHGIWVGNLSFKTTGKVLLDWFANRGLKEVTRLNLPGGKRAMEFNRGFAYLDFPSSTDVEIALGLSEQHLDGRKLLIKSSSDYTGRPTPSSSLPSISSLDPSSLTQSSSDLTSGAGVTLNKTARKILDRQKNPAGPTLFVGNLGFETTVDDIRGMFDAHQRGMGGWDKKEKVKTERPIEKEKQEEVDDESGEKGNEDEEVAEGTDEEDDDDDGEKKRDDDDEKDASIKKKESKEAKPKGPLDLSKAKDAGIRKVRLGTFEDSGKCKGWAFIDFHLPTQATRALLNIHNHTLNGRSLVLEYASAEAVRRGGLGTKSAGGGGKGGRGAAARDRGVAGKNERGEKKRGRDWDDGDVLESAKQAVSSSGYGDEGGAEDEDGGERRERREKAGRGGHGTERGAREGTERKRPQQGRAKPGAALASAQRASEAIVESRGKKITFD